MKSGNTYIPSKGDVVWLQFDPKSGHEQSGKRPAIVLSPYDYNKKVGLAIFCPITSRIKNYPFEVKIRINNLINVVILSDQIKSLDWKARDIEFIAKSNNKIMNKLVSKLSLLIF